MRVVALKAWSNGSISMEERQVKELPDALAAQLIAQGIVAPTALPEITDADAGKVLTATDSGVWEAQEPIGKKFIVTLTPTAQDYSGTMDKTVAEINAAYEAGRKIVFRIYATPTMYYDITATVTSKAESDDYREFGAVGLLNDTLILIGTPADFGTTATYSTSVYTLTPAT